MGHLPHLLRPCLLTALLWQLVACASVTPTYNARAYVDPSEEKHKQWENAAYYIEADETKDVELWEIGKVPAGLNLLEGGREVKIARAFTGKYEPIGHVSLDLQSARKWESIRGLLWTWKYEEKWRRYLCWPQVPLRYLTFFLWRLSPTNYLCEVNSLPLGSDEDARELLTRRAKAIAKAMGGNTLVLTEEIFRPFYMGEETDVYGNTLRIYKKRLDMLRGVVIRDKMFDPPPASAKDTVEAGADSRSSDQEVN